MGEEITVFESKETVISSKFSPLNPKGSLPPGVTARIVRNAYKTIPIRPRLVLSLAKIPARLSSPNVALREALDSPNVRDRLEKLKYKNKSLAFHQLLYDAIGNSKAGVGLHRRLIKPSLDTDQHGLVFLNTTRFNVLLITEMGGSDAGIQKVEPESTEEALALFALAFGLLQPDDAHDIVRSTLSLGDGFMTFFGIESETYPIENYEDEVQESEEDAFSSLESEIPEKAERQARHQDISSPSITPDDLPASKSTLRAEKPSVITENIYTTVFEVEEDKGAEIVDETNMAFDGIGQKESMYRNAASKLNEARKKRISLGAVTELDSNAIMQAVKVEEAAIKSLKSLEKTLMDEAKKLPNKIASLLCRYITGIDFEVPVTGDGIKAASWLDLWISRVAKIEELLKDLDRKESLLKNLLTDKRIEPKKATAPTTFKEIIHIMEECDDEIDQAISEARDWHAEVKNLQSLLMDCVNPVRSSALYKVEADSVYALIHLARYDRHYEPLLPLLFRLLGEIEELQEGDRQRFYIFIEESLQLAARHRDDELYHEITSFLPIAMLQNILRRGSKVLARYIILSTFQGSIARQNPIFFNEIWACTGWFERQETVGSKLTRIFDSLNRVYVEQSSIHAVVSVLKDSEKRWDTDGFTESIRYQESEDLSTRLENPSGMTGIFGRLRRVATNIFFMPIATKVRQRRYEEVKVAILELEQELRKGGIEKQIYQQLGESIERNIRNDHRESLKRFLETQLSATREWLEKERQINRTDISVKESEAEETARNLINNFFVEPGQSQAQHEVGDVKWIESCLRQLISDIRSNEIPDPSSAFFGNLPPIENLFPDQSSQTDTKTPTVILTDETDPEQPTQLDYDEWHINMPRSPIFSRLWLCYLDGHYSWQDLIQEGIALLLLNHVPRPIEVLNSFIECGRPDAVLEAVRRFNYNEVEGTEEVVQKAKDLINTEEKISNLLDETSLRINVFPRGKLKDENLLKLDDLETELLMAMELNDSFQLEKAEQSLEKILIDLDDLAKFALEDEQLRKELEAWLIAAGEKANETDQIFEMEQIANDVRQKAIRRREHILQLRKLDADNVPMQLRKKSRSIIRDIDHPTKWPSEEISNNTKFYLELLLDLSHDWWTVQNSLEPSDRQYQLVDTIISLLCLRLKDEIISLLEENNENAPILTSLLEPDSNKLQHLYKLLQNIGLLKKDIDVKSPPKQSDRTFTGTASDFVLQEEFTIRVSEVIENYPASAGSGKSVQEAFDAFRQMQYETALNHAATGWKWAKSSEASGHIADLSVIFALSHFELYGVASDFHFREIFGFLLLNLESIQNRAEINDSTIIKWWINLSGKSPPTTDKPNLTQEIFRRLVEIKSSEPGDSHREEFGYFLRLDPNFSFVRMLWRSVSGQDKLTLRTRTTLLTVLYDLGDFESLDSLFELSGENKRYLSAFVKLSTQVLRAPSPSLITAIRQSWVMLKTRNIMRPFQEFGKEILARIKIDEARQDIQISEILIPDSIPKCYQMLVTIKPDDTDPPLSLKLELLSEADFRLVKPETQPIIIVNESLMLSSLELDLVVRPNDVFSAQSIAIRLKGETASGRPISHIFRQDVTLDDDQQFEKIDVRTLLEIYEGYEGRPVSGHAFVGRKTELESMERSVGGRNPSAVILYGARRLGKTSLLDELRVRQCVTKNETCRTLFIVIPVDTFEYRDEGKNFSDLFFKLIRHSVNFDPKNANYRDLLENFGKDKRQLYEAAILDESISDAPFLVKLRKYLQNLRELAGNQFDSVVLVMDEFDKLLESYRRGYKEKVEELINQLRRAATEEEDIGIILAGSDLMKKVVGHYRSALYGSATVIELPCFDKENDFEDAYEVVSPNRIRGFRYFSKQIVKEIIQITGGHPLYLRLIGCVCSYITTRRRVSSGTVMEATRKFIREEVLRGDLPGSIHLVLQPLQALRLMETQIEEGLGRLMLLKLARNTSLERPWTQWATLSMDDELLALRQESIWKRIRNSLMDAGLLVVDDRYLWSFRFPIIAEALRKNYEVEFSRLYSEIEDRILET